MEIKEVNVNEILRQKITSLGVPKNLGTVDEIFNWLCQNQFIQEINIVTTLIQEYEVFLVDYNQNMIESVQIHQKIEDAICDAIDLALGYLDYCR